MGFQIVGERIAKYRKEKRLTQRELGEAIGVSSSAVSQWESGGTPDISLLPVLSDVLNVSIDQLFGRDDITKIDITSAFAGYMASYPEDQRVAALWDSLVSVLKHYMGEVSLMVPDENTELSYITDHGCVVSTSQNDTGFAAVVEDSFSFADLKDSKAKICTLFKTLSEEDALEVLLFLYRKPPKYCTIEYASSNTGISEERAKKIFETFTELNLTEKLDLETVQGIVAAYKIKPSGVSFPFLYAAWLLVNESSEGIHLICDRRKEKL